MKQSVLINKKVNKSKLQEFQSNKIHITIQKRMSQDSTSLQIFTKQIQTHSYSEKYQRWVEYLDKVEASSPEEYLTALTLFLEEFPFNYVYWISFVHYSNNLSSYETALKKNSKSFQLWSAYLLALKNNNCDQAKYKKQLQKAIFQVGADTRSISFYQEYYTMISENTRYEFYKKIMTRALIDLEDIFEMFKNWLKQLNESQVSLFYTKEMKGAIGLNSDQSLQARKSFIYEQIEKIYLKTLKYRQERLKIEQKIQRYYFEGTQEQRDEKKYWRQFFELQRKNGIVENISYCYQRSLMAQTDDFQLWDQVFHYLQHQTNKYTKVLSILRNNKPFFIKFSKQLFFYWCDLEERQNPTKARQMYKEICQINPSLETYQRHIQFEIRQKNYTIAKDLYDSMLTMYSADFQTLAYVLIEYSHFVVRYYKDYEYPKQLLKNYFEYLPYNCYLLTEYLEFMQHFQNNQGYYDQLMQILCEAVKKAKKSLRQQQFTQAIKMIKYYLRSVLGSIYLIKMSERRIIELAESIDAKKDQLYLPNEHPLIQEEFKTE